MDDIKEKWYVSVWKLIEDYITELQDPVNPKEIDKFLDIIEKKIECKKCKKHFHNFRFQKTFFIKTKISFRKKIDLEKWIKDLKKDIKNNKSIN